MRPLLLITLTLACVSTPAGGTDSDASGSSSGSSSTGAPTCDGPVGEGACAEVTVCEAITCGGKTAMFNHDGCPRATCVAHADCAEGWRCYALAYGAACIASQLTCEDLGGICSCGGTDDCGGLLAAHCLPDSVYPPADDCDLAAFDCTSFAAWHAALVTARQHHAETGHPDLVSGLGTCSQVVADARLTCGESACALLCELAPCAFADGAACEAACSTATAGVPAAEVEAVLQAVALAPASACDCQACGGAGPWCGALWGC